jgi:protocatechuate 3,4-dioxygenase beta subunit
LSLTTIGAKLRRVGLLGVEADMLSEKSSRRMLLTQAAAFGAVAIAAPARLGQAQEIAPTPQCHDGDKPTKEDIEGPFFKYSSPPRSDLVEPGTRGHLITLEGFVLSRSCRPVPQAILDFWHANEDGDYDEDGFRYRAHLFSDGNGKFRFRTIVPGLYPGRTRHFHMKVQAPNQPILTTQLYFPGEPRNRLDDYFSPLLLMKIAQSADEAAARFDFVLDIA